ncbi:MAG: deoxyribodipyrimidine photo-lyase [Solirubrobacteraceae bacterium]
MSVNVFWFRRDLRLEDNVGLYNALKQEKKVIPIFIFDKEIIDKLEKDDPRLFFISEQLIKINNKLKEFGSSLAIFYGTPKDVFLKFIEENEITAVYTNHDYEPYAIFRDNEINSVLIEKGIEFNTYKDQVIFEKNEVTKDDGLPYIVYTPYSKKWRIKLAEQSFVVSQSEKLLNNSATHNYPFFSCEEIGFKSSKIKVKNYLLSDEIIDLYDDRRNFPCIEGTSSISPHLRFGTISIREVVNRALKSKKETFLKELIWREFFMQILWHFPHTTHKSFKPKYDLIKWRNNEEEFELWCNGQTGYPLVDAGMRQLNTTGYMHNRVRMVVASFLCKHLLIDWRWGEAYFANKLLDYEQASNVGNWQWAAGSGVDAAPYFRIFNPSEQLKKFDSKAEYINEFVEDYKELTYSKPIVEHVFARERCLNEYKKALKES